MSVLRRRRNAIASHVYVSDPRQQVQITNTSDCKNNRSALNQINFITARMSVRNTERCIRMSKLNDTNSEINYRIRAYYKIYRSSMFNFN